MKSYLIGSSTEAVKRYVEMVRSNKICTNGEIKQSVSKSWVKI